MSVRRTILIEPYARGNWGAVRSWAAIEFVRDDVLRSKTVLFTAPTRREVADWLEAQRKRREIPLAERECVQRGRPCHDHCPHMYEVPA